MESWSSELQFGNWIYFNSTVVRSLSVKVPPEQNQGKECLKPYYKPYSCNMIHIVQARACSPANICCHITQSYSQRVSFFNGFIIDDYMVGGGALPTTAHMWKSADKFVELVFPFHLYVGCEGATRVAKRRGKHFIYWTCWPPWRSRGEKMLWLEG